jgi:hypothetical protein
MHPRCFEETAFGIAGLKRFPVFIQNNQSRGSAANSSISPRNRTTLGQRANAIAFGQIRTFQGFVVPVAL